MEQYRCALCDATYRTSLQAMLAHGAKHAANEFTRAYYLHRHRVTPVLAPCTHHYSKVTGKSRPPDNVRLARVVVPANARREGMRLVCRKRDTESYLHDPQAGGDLQGGQIRAFQRHEKKCKGA